MWRPYVSSEHSSKFSFRREIHHILRCENQSSSHISATRSIIAKSQGCFYKGWISWLKWFCDYKAQDRKAESGECRTSGKHVFLYVVTYERQRKFSPHQILWISSGEQQTSAWNWVATEKWRESMSSKTSGLQLFNAIHCNHSYIWYIKHNKRWYFLVYVLINMTN